MITRIELKNFMSHKHTVIEPAPGLTVLVGPNNIGKSAIVAALQILCHNDPSTYVLRHGEKECSVTIATDDGHSVQWRRRTSPSYVVDEQVFDRLRGSGLPDELHKVLRLPKVDAGGDADFDIHFGTQKSPIFLLGNTGSNAARFFASSSDAIRLVQIQKRHKEKLTEAQREKNRLEADSRKLNAELETLEPIVEVDRRLEALERIYSELVERSAEIDKARKHETALRDQENVLRQRAAEYQAVSTLAPPPELALLQPIEDLINTLQVVERRRRESELQTGALRTLSPAPLLVPTETLADIVDKTQAAEIRQTEAQARVAAMTLLAQPPQLEDVATLERLTEETARVAAQVARSSDEQHSLANLSSPPQLNSTASIEALIERIEQSADKLAATNAQNAMLTSLDHPPELPDETHLNALVDQFDQATTRRNQWKKMLSSLGAVEAPPIPVTVQGIADCVLALERSAEQVRLCQDEVQRADTELEIAGTALRAKAAGSQCPICGSALDPDRVIAQAAAGAGGHNHG